MRLISRFHIILCLIIIAFNAQSYHVNQKLEEVDLSGINLSNDSLTFNFPEKVKVLILDSCSLTKLPFKMDDLDQLEHLSLVNNKELNFNILIDSLIKFPKLNFLNLSHNNIDTLPIKSFGLLLHLKGLKLSHNKLDSTSIISLSELPKLNRLWLDNNELTSMDSVFFQFKKLKFLYLYENKINQILVPKFQTKKLWVLHLGNNQFKKLPTELIQIKQLKMVMINDNLIETVPQEYAKKSKHSLFALNLDDNLLSDKEKIKAEKYFNRLALFTY